MLHKPPPLKKKYISIQRIFSQLFFRLSPLFSDKLESQAASFSLTSFKRGSERLAHECLIRGRGVKKSAKILYVILDRPF